MPAYTRKRRRNNDRTNKLFSILHKLPLNNKNISSLSQTSQSYASWLPKKEEVIKIIIRSLKKSSKTWVDLLNFIGQYHFLRNPNPVLISNINTKFVYFINNYNMTFNDFLWTLTRKELGIILITLADLIRLADPIPSGVNRTFLLDLGWKLEHTPNIRKSAQGASSVYELR